MNNGACPSNKPAGRKILLIEDDPSVACSTKLRIEKMGELYSVDLAGNATQAYSLFEPNKYFAVMVDLNIDGDISNGISIAVRLRELDEYVFIAAFTGYYPVFDSKLIESIDDFIQKPVNIDVLMAKLFMWTSRHHRRKRQRSHMEYIIDERITSYLNTISEIRSMEEKINKQIREIATHIGLSIDDEMREECGDDQQD